MVRRQPCRASSLFHPLPSLRSSVLPLMVWLFAAMASGNANADLDSRIMYSIEWLVDESDTIVIVRDSRDFASGNPEVIKCLKGDAASIQWPLTAMTTRWPDYKNCIPPSTGPVRLLFIRESSLLLQSVSLGRQRAIPAIGWTEFFTHHEAVPLAGIHSTLYGVTQFGDLLLTESSLHAAIEARLKQKRTPVKVRANLYSAYELDSVDLGMKESEKFACSSTPSQFPLEHNNEIFSIVVPSDTIRRDHYLEQLKSGGVIEKIFAVHQLASMMDPPAHAALRVASQSDEVEFGYGGDRSTTEIGEWNSVRMAATTELQKIDQQRDSFLDQLSRPAATEKIDAIRNLVFFDDPKAIEAIRKATQTESAIPLVDFDHGTTIDVETVRKTAAAALEQIERNRVNSTKSP